MLTPLIVGGRSSFFRGETRNVEDKKPPSNERGGQNPLYHCHEIVTRGDDLLAFSIMTASARWLF